MVWVSWGLRNGYAIDCTFLLFLLYLHNARDKYIRMELVTQAHVMSSIVTVPEAHDMLMIMKQTTHANVVCPFLTRSVVRLKVRTWHTSACFTRCQLRGPKTQFCALSFFPSALEGNECRIWRASVMLNTTSEITTLWSRRWQARYASQLLPSRWHTLQHFLFACRNKEIKYRFLGRNLG